MKKIRKIWNNIICPAIDITVEVLGIGFAVIGLPILAILIFG